MCGNNGSLKLLPVNPDVAGMYSIPEDQLEVEVVDPITHGMFAS